MPFSSMPLESRSHMVSFRLTREEHDRFRELCLSHGLPSISEMARAAIKMMFGDPAPHQSFESRLADLETRVAFLTTELQKLTHEPLPQPIQTRRASAT
jgi:hypothetical protein